MATTAIDAHKTITEIMILLSQHGITDIRTQYDNGRVVGLQFVIANGDTKIPFRMPIKYNAVLETMKADKKTPRHFCNEEQAIRVAWRQILRWIQAQLALIEINMANIKEVFMPYILISKDQTFYERLEQNNFMQIEFKP